MKRASAIVTNRGGRTCRRERSLPASWVSRQSSVAAMQPTCLMRRIGDRIVRGGDTGYVYRGKLDFEVITTDMGNLPEIPVKIMMNVGTRSSPSSSRRSPTAASACAPGVRHQQHDRIHPKAILDIGQVPRVCATRSPAVRVVTLFINSSSSRSWSRAWPPSRRPSSEAR